MLTCAFSASPDFADFAEAPSPAPESAPPVATLEAATPEATVRPYTKWYNVHERHSLSEFKIEGYILAISCFVFLLHAIGARMNRNKAKAWAKAHAPALKKEFALVGFGGVPTLDTDIGPETVLKEKSLFEFSSYATGRQNAAFVDVNLKLNKRFNPIVNCTETAFGFFLDSFPMPHDIMEAKLYPFDGKETLTLPSVPGAAEVRGKDPKSTYDGFVWAIVNKDQMQQARETRYDLSLTFTKDNNKLPNWLTVMSESAEITETLLTPELVDAVQAAGDLFEFIIITDQAVDRPTSIEETVPRKRIVLKYRLPSNNNYEGLVPLFSYFLRLPDVLVAAAHFRPEVSRKVRNARESMIAEIKKAAEDEKAEERLLEKEKAKKAKRDADLKLLDAKAQKKYLDKEREKEQRKAQKRQTMRA